MFRPPGRRDGVAAGVRPHLPLVVHLAVAAAARHVPHLPPLAAGRGGRGRGGRGGRGPVPWVASCCSVCDGARVWPCACRSVAVGAAGAAPAARGLGGVQQLVGQHVHVVGGAVGGRARAQQLQQLGLVVVAHVGRARAAPLQHGHRLRLSARDSLSRRAVDSPRRWLCWCSVQLWCVRDTTLLDSKLKRLFFYLCQIDNIFHIVSHECDHCTSV